MCPYTQPVWHTILTALPIQVPQLNTGMLQWWLQLRNGHCSLKQKGIDSLFMIVTWSLWKERNGRVFGGRQGRTVSDMVHSIWQEGELWVRHRQLQALYLFHKCGSMSYELLSSCFFGCIVR
jgi:hypothetical protein